MTAGAAIAPAPRRGWWARLRKRLRPPRRLTFTRDGRVLFMLALGIGFGAINTGNNLLYLLVGWLCSFIVASGVLSEVTMKGLTVRRRPPARLFAGQPFLMEIAVENGKPSLASFSIEIEDLVGGRPLDKKCYFLKIPAGKTQRTSYRHTFARRGTYTLDGFRIATKFPFGFFRKSRDIDEPTEVLVYPALVPVVRPMPRTESAGDARAARLGRRGEFHGLREWRQGDDRRDVHWKSTARSGRTMVREYEDELMRRVVVCVDNALPAAVRTAVEDGLAPPEIDALERAISVAASLAAAYLDAGWSVALVARGAQVPTSAGRSQLPRILRALALLDTVGDDTPFAAPLPPRTESVLVHPRGVVVAGRPSGAARVVEA
ncbi:MAG: DUF58 domain-containing protein [Deltaproteobacteria bacterium]|nr:DUF58 domain-containing protein [Deltaproteobacteria bacterium]